MYHVGDEISSTSLPGVTWSLAYKEVFCLEVGYNDTIPLGSVIIAQILNLVWYCGILAL